MPEFCTCANPAQWLEVSCAEHGEQARALLAAATESIPPEPAPTPSKEIVPRDRSKINLRSPTVRFVATLDAQGMSGKDISDAVGVSQTRVSQIRNGDGYEDLRDQMMSAANADIAPMVKAAMVKTMVAYDEAVEVLRELLRASDADGNILYGVRKDAAKIIVADAALMKRIGGLQSDGDQGAKGAGAVLNITINADGVVSTEKEEVAEDGDWEAPENGDPGTGEDPDAGSAACGGASEDDPEYVAPPEPGADVGF